MIVQPPRNADVLALVAVAVEKLGVRSLLVALDQDLVREVFRSGSPLGGKPRVKPGALKR